MAWWNRQSTKKLVENMMSKEPERMQRLTDLGFDTSKAYLHGTPKVFEEFDPTRTTFVSPDVKFSEMFSGNAGQTMPLFVKHEGIIDLSDRAALEKLVNELRQYPDKEKAQNAVDYINLIVEKPKNNWMAAKQLHPILKDLGYKGATETEFNSKNLALFNPSEQVKSVWAKGKGPGLIGGTAAAALLGGSDEAEAGNKKALNDLIKKMRGRSVEEIETELAKMYDLSYRGGHTAPIPSESTAKITELDKIYPADIYGPNARRYYGDQQPYDWQSLNVLQSVRGKENAPVTMYRALPKQSSLFDELKNLQAQQAYILKYGKVPSNIETSLNKSQVFEKNYDRIDALKKELETNPEVIKRPEIIPGDWVTLSKDYAKQHAEGLENPTIIQKTVPAGELYTDANSIHEQGWWPFKAVLAAPMTALSTAQEINPLNLLGSLVNKYRGAQEKVADVITEQVNPYKKQPVDETAKGLGRMMFDPLNLVEGPIGHALMSIELMSNKKEKLP